MLHAGPWLLGRRQTAHPHSIFALSFDSEHRLVSESEQAGAISGVFWIGGHTKAGRNRHLQAAIRQKRRLTHGPAQLLSAAARRA